MVGIEVGVNTAGAQPLGMPFFEAAAAAFARAEQPAGLRERFLDAAGRTIALRFAGPRIESVLWPAFAHLACDRTATIDLTIDCWDDASARVVTPEPPGAADRAGLDFVDGPVRLAWDASRRALAAFDPERRLGLLRFPDVADIEVWERSAPARRILHWWAAAQGMQLVHAAAVGTPNGGVLLVGRGGSGKSTTALACVDSGLLYAGDDYALVSLEAAPRVHSLYGTGKADADSIGRLPRLRDAFAASALRIGGKTMIEVAQAFPAAMIASFPLRAIVVPRVLEGTPRVARLSPATALRALAPSTMMQLPGDREGTLSRLAKLVREVPCFELAVGPDPAAAVPLLARLSGGEFPL